MFVFGKKVDEGEDEDKTRCNDDGCACWCETQADKEGEAGSCDGDEVEHLGFNLYKFTGKYFLF